MVNVKLDGHFCCYIQKQYTSQAYSKRGKLSLPLFVLVSRVNEKLR